MAMHFTGDIEQTSDLIVRGIREDLSRAIEQKMHHEIDPMLKEIAKDYAKRIVVNLQSAKFMQYDNLPREVINMRLVFNKEEIPLDK